MYSFQNLGHNIHRTWQKMSWLVLTTITMHCGHQKEHLVKLMRSHLIYLPLCLWELDLVSRTRKKDPSLEMRCYRRLPNISYKDHVTNQEVRSRVQDTIGVYGDLLTMVKKRMATSQDPPAWRRRFCRWQWNEKEEEDDRRGDGKTTSTNGQERGLEIPWGPRKTGNGGKVNCCNVSCSGRLRNWDEMRWSPKWV